MKRKRTFGLWMVLLMFVMTACGKSQNAASEYFVVEESEPEIQSESHIQDSGAEIQDKPEENEAPEAQIEELKETEADTHSEPANQNLPVQGDSYYDLINVVLYLDVYHELPPNYITKSEAQALGWEGGSVEKYKEGAAIGGDYFGNREGLLPAADGRKYTECDIDTHGYSSRGSRRLVFSNDGLYFYTSDHYESFSEVTVTEDYEVIW